MIKTDNEILKEYSKKSKKELALLLLQATKLNQTQKFSQPKEKKIETSTQSMIAYFDGACEPRNPGGNMGIGAIVMRGKDVLFEHSHFIKADPSNSNNVAEYMAIIAVFDWLIANNLTDQKITIHGDSKLVVEQMSGNWKIKQGAYVYYAKEAKEKLKKLHSPVIKWIPRERNELADILSKKHLDETYKR